MIIRSARGSLRRISDLSASGIIIYVLCLRSTRNNRFYRRYERNCYLARYLGLVYYIRSVLRSSLLHALQYDCDSKFPAIIELCWFPERDSSSLSRVIVLARAGRKFKTRHSLRKLSTNPERSDNPAPARLKRSCARFWTI